MEELAHYRCVGSEGTRLTVVESRYVHVSRGDGSTRRHLGARRLMLETGEAVRYIDPETFEIAESGELLRRLT